MTKYLNCDSTSYMDDIVGDFHIASLSFGMTQINKLSHPFRNFTAKLSCIDYSLRALLLSLNFSQPFGMYQFIYITIW